MLAALKLTLMPSIWPASSLALSSHRSARAGEAVTAASEASVTARTAERRRETERMRSVFVMKYPRGIEMRAEGSCKVCLPTSIRAVTADGDHGRAADLQPRRRMLAGARGGGVTSIAFSSEVG